MKKEYTGMFASRCVLEGKRGIKELDNAGVYAIITNRTLVNRGEAHKFVLVNTRKLWVDSVYRSNAEAEKALQDLSRPA
jgi:hypothetical protein